MLFATPTISRALAGDLRRLDAMRERLGDATGVAGPWLGQLRRQTRASTMGSSVAIEGFRVPSGDRAAIVSGAVTPDANDDDRMALACYAHAMDHVGTLAIDPHFAWDRRVLLDLHFDACSFQRDRRPGLLRTEAVYVTSPGGGPAAFTGPPADDVLALLDEAVAWLAEDTGEHVVVRAAMAHLHLVSIHPFADGNGRVSRILQSLVLARSGLLAPEFGSIEEVLGRRTAEYYDVLQQVQGGAYHPQRDAGPWVRFCVTAHLEQAEARLAQIEAAARRWSVLEALVEDRGWPDRLVIALEQGLFDGVDRRTYTLEADVSPATASADLTRLVDAGLLVAVGRGRSTRYVASPDLRARIL